MLEIAGGIVLAVVLVAFWRWVAVGAVVTIATVVLAAMVAGGMYLWTRDLSLAAGLFGLAFAACLGAYSGLRKKREDDIAEGREIARLMKQHGH